MVLAENLISTSNFRSLNFKLQLFLKERIKSYGHWKSETSGDF